MGIQSPTDGIRNMKFLLACLVCASVALAVPEGRRLRPEEHWRPAEARDISKYTPKHAMAPGAEGETWEEHMIKITKAAKKFGLKNSSKMGSKYDLKETCGIEGPPAKAEGRIVGGVEAEPNQWPWQVALFIDDAWFCGGALISENWVVTAAHCADGASYFDVMAGAHDVRASSEPNRVEITSYNGIVHENYDDWALVNDIALVELPTPITFNDYIKPACLPSVGDTADVDELVTCTGWGKPSDSAGGIAPKLRMVSDLPVISNAECDSVYGIVGDGVVCIDTTGGKGTCNGDSGGPLNMKAEVKAAGQQWKQVGVVSFGASSGCEVGLPSGFTRTEYFLDWISDNSGVSY